MSNLNKDTTLDQSSELKESSVISRPLILIIIVTLVVAVVAWQFLGENVVEPTSKEPARTSPIKNNEVVLLEPLLPDTISEAEEIIEEAVPPVEEVQTYLPPLNDSDNWLKEKLPTLTWRKELLKLVIDEDIIRRFVVFTDNFSQGIIAYEHSPFIVPNVSFSPDEEHVTFENNQNVWQWNEASTKRFDLYVELLRSFDSVSLIQWYMELKPLIDEAYTELGYEDDFTKVLQDAITLVLDMELPKSSMAVIRPSVMYQYQDPNLEKRADVEKLLLRLGKDNLLVIKSVLLELNEKLAQQQNGIH